VPHSSKLCYYRCHYYYNYFIIVCYFYVFWRRLVQSEPEGRYDASRICLCFQAIVYTKSESNTLQTYHLPPCVSRPIINLSKPIIFPYFDCCLSVKSLTECLMLTGSAILYQLFISVILTFKQCFKLNCFIYSHFIRALFVFLIVNVSSLILI